MKKLFLCAAVVLAAVAGTFCYNSESRNVNEMSDLAKANVKALAEEESYIKEGVCPGVGPNMSDVWCYGGDKICCWAHAKVYGKE